MVIRCESDLRKVLKCLHQVALDRWAWNTGLLLVPVEDPLAPEEFGGDPEELKAAHGYQTALSELKKLKVKKQDSSSSEESGEDKQKKKKKKRDKGGGGGKGAGKGDA